MSSPNSSPRLSFSSDLINPSNLPSPPRKHRNPSSSSSFDFANGLDSILPQDPIPADEIFSGGRILPLPLKNPNPIPDAVAVPKKSSWRFGRSNSLNLGGCRRINLFRSKSAGSGPNPDPVGNPNPKPPLVTKKRSRAMSPVVPYFPKEGNGMGIIGFLLCSCGGGGGGGKRMDYYCSP